MTDLGDFAERVEEQLLRTNREPLWAPDEAEHYMAQVNVRRQLFEEIARRLNDTVIQPRLEILAGNFSNASLSTNEPVGRCHCWFGYCERFPASTRVAFSVEHDIRLEKLAVCYEASMIPLFIQFNQHDRFTVKLDDVKDCLVGDWVEERLLEFLDAYLQIDRGSEGLEDEVVTDPVCGMRLGRSSAAASDAYQGHPYYFCSTDCQQKFTSQPTAYVKVKTI